MSTAPASDGLRVDDVDRVRYLTIDRPEKRNALTPSLLARLVDAVVEAEAAQDVGCIVLRGAGAAFCAGMDIDPAETDMGFDERSFADELVLLDQFRRLEDIWRSRTPVIASVHGYCLGVGTDLAFCCDMTLAAEDAQFGYPPVRSMGAPPSHMWTYLAGPQWAKRLLLTGDMIDGATAARAGFVLEALPADELERATHELADRIARVPPDVLAANKSMCNKVLELMGRTLAQELAREVNTMAHQSPHAVEFGRRATERGLKAALAWQDERFSR
ncbi:MAG: enoyl-CoA hydratase/isomerase family protein [Acidimicrobiales bacterium]|nr:enoyl-CoA hydratase/isomerase family protein [Acidimicrobiales bacterium]